jgi:hypothetical protein
MGRRSRCIVDVDADVSGDGTEGTSNRQLSLSSIDTC